MQYMTMIIAKDGRDFRRTSFSLHADYVYNQDEIA